MIGLGSDKKDLIQLYRFIDLIPREVTDKYKKWFNVGGGGGKAAQFPSLSGGVRPLLW